ncbi:MAG: hypothetical protein VXB01_09000, partial [Opitutae bacterium]
CSNEKGETSNLGRGGWLFSRNLVGHLLSTQVLGRRWKTMVVASLLGVFSQPGEISQEAPW